MADRANVGWDVRWVAEVDSTNSVALELARDGAPEGLVIVADHQTAGRGRLGRVWESPPGASLLASFLLRPGDDLPPDHAHLLTAAVGLAAAAACADLTGVRPDLKWPNDLVVGRRKLGGILAEADVRGARLATVVVGLGLNVAWAPGPEAISLSEVSTAEVDRDALLERILSELDRRYPVIDPVAAEFRLRCSTLGQRVHVEMANDAFEGVAVELSPEGHLGVDRADGSRRWVAAGDVTHVRSA
jgi:BirA family biotin operon repressor/biotin-[acetyl-CoA-carboxylase] ligase